MSSPHYDTTLQALGGHLNPHFPPRRADSTRGSLTEWAATVAVTLVCAAAVVYTYTVGGLLAALAATLLICTAAAIGGTR